MIDEYAALNLIKERIERAYKSRNGLYPHEILILSYANKYMIGQTSFPKFWDRKYNVSNVDEILKMLYKRDFITSGTVCEALYHWKTFKIKNLLNYFGFSFNGSRPNMIKYAVENIPEEDLEEAIPDRYYTLTPLGIKEIEENQEVIKIHNFEYNEIFNLNIWIVNQLRYENPGKEIKDLINERIITCLKEKIENSDYFQIFDIMDFAIPFLLRHEEYDIALFILSLFIYYEFNHGRMQIYNEPDLFHIEFFAKDIFPYSCSSLKLRDEIKDWLEKVKYNLSLSYDELYDRLLENTKDLTLDIEVLKSSECAKIAILDMRGELYKIEEIGMMIKDRYSKSLKQRERKKTWKDYIILPDKIELSDEERLRIEKRDEFLLNSFVVLKDNFYENHKQISEMMAQLQGRHPEEVIEMWKYLINENWEKVVQETEIFNSTAYYLTDGLMSELTMKPDFINFESYFISEPAILRAVYEYSPCISNATTSVIATQIRNKNFEAANMMMEFMFANKKNNFYKTDEINDYEVHSFSDIFGDMIDKYITTSRLYYGGGLYMSDLGIEIDQEIIDFLTYWANQIENPVEGTKVKILIAGLM